MSRLIDAKKAYPAPTLPAGRIVVGKPIKVSYDLADSGWGFPHRIEFVLINQNYIGTFSEPSPYVPGRANETEVDALKVFKADDKVTVYARLWYTVKDSDGIHDIVAETPRSKVYDVVA